MTKKGLIWIIIVWGLITLINYYYVSFFFLGFIWLGMILTLLLLTITQIIKAIDERKGLSKLRIAKILVFTGLLLLTFFSQIVNIAIEKVDWLIFENKRMEIVQQVKNKTLNPNVSWNEWVCELPFEFPIVSNGGNDIGISRNDKNDGTTITFWVFRNFFDSPSTHFIYTDDKQKVRELERKIKEAPENNWKIKENWYRTYGY